MPSARIAFWHSPHPRSTSARTCSTTSRDTPAPDQAQLTVSLQISTAGLHKREPGAHHLDGPFHRRSPKHKEGSNAAGRNDGVAHALPASAWRGTASPRAHAVQEYHTGALHAARSPWSSYSMHCWVRGRPCCIRRGAESHVHTLLHPATRTAGTAVAQARMHLGTPWIRYGAHRWGRSGAGHAVPPTRAAR